MIERLDGLSSVGMPNLKNKYEYKIGHLILIDRSKI